MPKIDSIINEVGGELDERQRRYPRLIQAEAINPNLAKAKIERLTSAWQALSVMTQAEFDALLERYEQRNNFTTARQLGIFEKP